jgi:hypothetical protein
VILVSESVAIAGDVIVDPLSLPEEVVKAVSQIQYSPYSSRLKRIVMTVSTGQLGSTPVTNDYEPLGQGLWGIRSVSKQNSSAVEGASISICGLVELVGASKFDVNYETTISVPVGRLFLPYGLKGHMDGATTSRANNIALGSGAERLCNPVPGDVLAYEVQSESSFAHTTTSYSGSSSRASINVFRWKCTVGAPKPISELVAEQDGTYLPVTCSGINESSNINVSAEYAFLQPFGIYLVLRRVGGTFSSKTSISSFAHE